MLIVKFKCPILPVTNVPAIIQSIVHPNEIQCMSTHTHPCTQTFTLMKSHKQLTSVHTSSRERIHTTHTHHLSLLTFKDGSATTTTTAAHGSSSQQTLSLLAA